MGSKGNQVSTQQQQTYTPNPFVAGAGQQAIGKAETAASAPFQQPVAPVAPFSGIQQQAINYVPSLQNFAMPYFNTGAGLLGNSAAPVSGTDVANYYNPMASNVTAQMQNIFGQQQRNTTGQLTQAAGGVGADRIAVGQSELANQQGLAAGQTYAGLYQQALQAAQQQKQMEAGAGMGIAQMGPAAQASQANWVNQMLGVGGMQQQLSQQQQNAQYQQQLARIAYPFQTAQYLAGITGGLAGSMGGTTTGNTTTTYPTPSPMAQILGLGTAGLGAYGATGGFGGMFSGPSNGYGTQGMGGWYGRGGRAMADGGEVPPFFTQRGRDAIYRTKVDPLGQWYAYKPRDLVDRYKETIHHNTGGESLNPRDAQAIAPDYADGGDVEPQITFPGASPIPMGGSPIPTLRLPMSSGRSGPGGEWMQMRDLPMQPSGSQNKQGTTGTAGDIAAATKFLETIPEARGGPVNPMYMGQGYQDGGELGEVFPNSLAQDANPTPMEYDTGLNKPDVMSPSPPMGGGPMAGAPSPEAAPLMSAQAAPAPPAPSGHPSVAESWPTKEQQFAPAPMSVVPKQESGDPYSADQPPLSHDQIRREAIFAAQKYGIPVDMAMRLIQQESGFQAHATSSAGAEGPMQLMPGTAKDLGVNRFNTYENIHGGMRYLRQMYDKFGNWTDAVAAYNAGPGRVASRTGLPAETRGYVAAIRPGDTSNMVAGPGVPGKGDRLDMAPEAPPGAAPREEGPMGSTGFREPYPDALNRDWGQKATRSPWMSLVKAGAQMATTVGPIGSVIGQGIKAGAGELEEQRKALTGEEAINLKAKALHDTANYHLDMIAARRENRMARVQALTGLHPTQIVKIQEDVNKMLADPSNPETVALTTPEQREDWRQRKFEQLVSEAANKLRQQQGQPAGGTAAAAASPAPQPVEDDPGAGKRIVGHLYRTEDGTVRPWKG